MIKIDFFFSLDFVFHLKNIKLLGFSDYSCSDCWTFTVLICNQIFTHLIFVLLGMWLPVRMFRQYSIKYYNSNTKQTEIHGCVTD